MGKTTRLALQTFAAMMFALFVTSAHSASKTILVLGDSLSAEYGLPRGTGWVSLLERRLKSENIDAEVVNASISGDTTAGGRARFQALLVKHKPTTVVIELGGNDALRGLPLTATRDNLDAMTATARKTGATVLLLGMQIPPNYGADYTKQFAATFAEVAKANKVPLVPFMLAGVADSKEDMFQSDRIHPAAEAHPIILNNIWPKLKPLLQAK